jgi:hypothetical protein
MEQTRRVSDFQSGQRRRVFRVRADVSVLVVHQDDTKRPARLMDVGLGGMHVASPVVPDYGEQVRILVKIDASAEWLLLPSRVRWFTRGGFGVEFESLDQLNALRLAEWVDSLAA